MVESTTETPLANKSTWPEPPDKPVATCHCGAVKVELPWPPTKVNECRCSVCYRYGALWTYFRLNEVNVTTSGSSTLRRYVREDGDGDIAFYCCSNCGCLTHWLPTVTGLEVAVKAGRAPGVGVNCRMFPPKMLEGLERKTGRENEF